MEKEMAFLAELVWLWAGLRPVRADHFRMMFVRVTRSGSPPSGAKCPISCRGWWVGATLESLFHNLAFGLAQLK